MATTLMPLDPAVSPQRATRLLPIYARLLPEEIIAGRRARRTRTWVIVAVVLVACLCGMWAVYANRETRTAEDDLTAASAEVTRLQLNQREFAPVVEVLNDTRTLEKQLAAVMTKDLDWAALLKTLRTAGTASGIEIAGVDGKLIESVGKSAASANTLPSTGKAKSIGTLVVTGTGPDKEAVAEYADKLAKQPAQIANPYVTSVTSKDGGEVTFSLNIDITQTSLCGRFSADECKGGN